MEPKYREVWAKAPASIANLGPGFDVLALSFSAYWDFIGVKYLKNGSGVFLGRDSVLGGSPEDAQKNIASFAVKLVLEKIRERLQREITGGYEVTLLKSVPVCSGMGSSAASSVAAVLAATEMFKDSVQFDTREMLAISGRAESLSSGEPHFDNAAASLAGGCAIVFGNEDKERVNFLRLGKLPNWWMGVVTPEVRSVTTKEAREVLPSQVDFRSAAKHAGAAAAVIGALASRDLESFAQAVSADYFVTPRRLKLYGETVYNQAFESGRMVVVKQGWSAAIGIAGAGPSIFTISDTPEHVSAITSVIAAVLGNGKIVTGKLDIMGASSISAYSAYAKERNHLSRIKP